MKTPETTIAEVSVGPLAVTAAEVAGPYSLRLVFSNGERRTVDFGPFLRRAAHPAIRTYLEKERFRQFELVNGNVNWNDYDLIFPVADLYAGVIQ